MPEDESIFKFNEKGFKQILSFLFKKLVVDQYKFWFGFAIATILFILRG